MTTKRGVNLGCGRVTLPCERPKHHELVPEFLYTDPDIQWDNVDWNAGEGVSHVVDLFDYPWALESDTYDYAIASHIVEHIPHHIVERGQFVHRHELYQDGWFYWFSELNRILKPGGQAFILCPYAFSNGGISDPTHTRYVTFATFYYLIDNAESPFTYRKAGRWADIDSARNLRWTPHVMGVRKVRETMHTLGTLSASMTHGVVTMADGWKEDIPRDDESMTVFNSLMWDNAQTTLNTFADIMVILEKASDADHG